MLKSLLKAAGRQRLSTLVLAEHASGAMSTTTLAAVAAARQMKSSPIRLLVAGSPDHTEALAKAAESVDGVDEVLTASHDAYAHALPENFANLVVHLQKSAKYSHIVAPATSFGKDCMPRIAALLDVAPVSDVIEVKSGETFRRPIYAGNVIATVKASDSVKVVTVRPSAFAPASTSSSSKAKVTAVAPPDNAETGQTKWVGDEIAKSDRPDLTGAKIVIAGGRALKSKENFDRLYKLADILRAAVGASRAAVDAGYCPNDLQVGQTGKVVAPQLYMAFGISGAIQHLAGMKDSKVIVAVNKDKEAPIFQVADYGLVADIFQALDELESELAAK